MAPVLFGLNLGEFKWSKFGNKNMWNNVYHLRRTKFIVYQCALIFCVISESLGTDCLSDYVDQQEFIAKLNNNALEYNDNYVGIASYNIFAGVFVAFVFGAAFFFDLIWPERHEDRGIRIAWKVCSVFATTGYLAAALGMTIITATKSAYVTGVGADEASRLLEQYSKASETPLVYRHNARAVTSVVFSWLGWVSTLASAIILIISKNHDEQYGPWSSHIMAARNSDPEVKAASEKVAPPPIGPSTAHPITDTLPAAGSQPKESFANEYPEANGNTSHNHPQASFEQAEGTRPVSTV
ncbi:hypothetical protein AAFC00_006754 [Neodothiora populina]|uniref:Uncharacterized protein n=1 Tax=Neodothiora populina TaxID=2781224 RepID=A0ABR3PB30_9PEZI